MNYLIRKIRRLPPDTQHFFLICAVMAAAIIQIMDTTIANVALPHMQGTFSVTQDNISWVLTSYIIASAIAMPLTGWVAGRIGRKRLLEVSVLGFTLASMACGASQSLNQIIFCRILQGIFGAALVPISQALLLDTFPMHKHAKAMGIWGIGVMVAPVLGPTAGGWLTEYYNWRWVFYINVPFGVFSLLGIMALAKESPLDKERPFDMFGFILLSISVVSLQLMLDRGHSQYWFESREIVIELIVSLLAFYLFLVHMFTHPHCYVEPRLFKDRNFTLGLVFMFLLGVIMLATMALFPPYLQTLMGYPVLDAGIILAPRGVGTMIAMMISSRVMERNTIPPRYLIVIGLSFIVITMLEMTRFTVDATQSMITWTGFFQGFGLGCIFVPLSTLAFATLDNELRTDATSVFGLIRTLGSSLGISIVVTELASNLQSEHATLTEHVTVFNPLLQSTSAAAFWNLQTPQGLAMIEGEVARQALQLAYADAFQLIVVMALLAIPSALLLRAPTQAAPRKPAA